MGPSLASDMATRWDTNRPRESAKLPVFDLRRNRFRIYQAGGEIPRRSATKALSVCAIILGCLSDYSPSDPRMESLPMSPQEKAEALGVKFTKQEPGYLAMVVRSGNLLITSGHVSDTKGKLGAGMTVDQGKAAARECAEKILNSIWNFHGSLNGLRVLKLLGCVNSTLEFHEQHLVINGCSDLLHEIYGKTTDGFHARSALGFAQIPTGSAVEVEAIFEIKS